MTLIRSALFLAAIPVGIAFAQPCQTYDASLGTLPNEQGWGYGGLQPWTASVADGVLTIEARVESAGGKPYTSGRVNTEGKRFFKYGRVDIRAKMPRGRGPWPALWMLGENHAEVGWPRCGEIDIVEKTGRNERKALGTAHWYHDTPEPGNNASYGGHTSITSGDLADEFHVYSVVWDKRKIRWYLDGARKLYSGHRRLLGRYLPHHRGLNVEQLLATMQEALRPVLRARGEDRVQLDPTQRPRMEWA